MKKEINIKKLKQVVQQKKGWIFMIISLPLLSMFVYLHLFAEPIYQKSAQLLVSQADHSTGQRLETQMIQADLQLINTYSAIILSPRILNAVSEALNEDYSISELSERLSVSNATNSQIIEINAYHRSPKVAARIANTTAKIFSEEIPSIMNIDNVTILAEDEVLPNERPTRPHRFLLLTLTFFLSLLLAFTFVFVLLVLERSFSSTTEIEEILDLQILGEVSKEKQTPKFEPNPPRSTRRRARV
ncbi:YveK family protein [Candidatus Enterococcus mangumiae]|uniref:Capsular polysaccharide biosynthesis protein CpsC n=1 Tax=Candidatus Enterococcus mangumiae TaxID=2230878 RepID=A0ABZ2SUG5_9ENTE|nr:Wzz/FepE/Etk N-terminal domain-containing protein [Enterococcus sp. DIV1094]MBO0488947.1 capsular biosynthesis protein [Enterococcus sp. DIV1094]